MSDVMLFGVLRMPYEIAMGGEISRRQFWCRAQEAANRIEALEAEVAKLRAEKEAPDLHVIPPPRGTGKPT